MRDAAGSAPSGNQAASAIHGVRPHLRAPAEYRAAASENPPSRDPAAPSSRAAAPSAASAPGFDNDHRDLERDLTPLAAPLDDSPLRSETPAQGESGPVPDSAAPDPDPSASDPEPPGETAADAGTTEATEPAGDTDAAGPDAPAPPDGPPARLITTGLAGSPLPPRDIWAEDVPAVHSATTAQPPWSEVIATTLRLWLHRRARRGRLRRVEARRSGTRRRAMIFGIVIVVFAAGGLTFALAQAGTTAARPRAAASAAGQAPALSPAALAAATANRDAAAAWVATQVSHSVVVACDPAMCAELQGEGFPAGDLLSLGATANDPLGSAVVVSTTALRNQFGRRLPDVYAPVVLATFGTGETRVDIRVEAPDGSQAYLVEQRADQLARQMAGQQLLANKDLHVSGLAAQEIGAGRLDSRLLLTLAALATQVHKVFVVGVGDSGPGAGSAVPLRMLQLDGFGPGQGRYLNAVLAFLKAQQPPYLASITVLHQAGGALVQVEFPAPSPLGLLGARAST
jgi:hypothetical protein